MSTYRVAEGTQLNVDGTVYSAGDVVDVDDENTARAWLASGLVEEAADKPDKRYRRPK